MKTTLMLHIVNAVVGAIAHAAAFIHSLGHLVN